MSSPRVVHCQRDKFDVYIGRPSKWGNPFSHKSGTLAQFRVATREEAVARYREWFPNQPQLVADLGELIDRVLGCWCAPHACHGDVLAEFADRMKMLRGLKSTPGLAAGFP